MQEPLQIAFHNMESSAALEHRVRELFRQARALLRRHRQRAHRARGAPQAAAHGRARHQHQHGLPGRDIVVKREQRVHEADNHSICVPSEAFEAAGRQVEEYSRMRRRDGKAHEAGQRYSRVARLYPEQDYGFLETPEGQNVYFHRAMVRGDHFDALEVGSEVIYTPADEEGSMRPMASSVQLIGSDHRIV